MVQSSTIGYVSAGVEPLCERSKRPDINGVRFRQAIHGYLPWLPYSHQV